MGPTLMMSPPTLHFYKYPSTLLPSSLFFPLLLHLLIHFSSRFHPLALGLEPLGVGFPRCSPNHHLGMLFSFFLLGLMHSGYCLINFIVDLCMYVFLWYFLFIPCLNTKILGTCGARGVVWLFLYILCTLGV